MDKHWVLEKLENIAAFGKGMRGISRLAFTQADLAAREYVTQLMEEIGLDVHVDQIGNIIGRMEGQDREAPAVVTGSHLDTVPGSGKYDGAAGVVGGLAAVKSLKEKGCLTHPVEVVVFAFKESSRFTYATMGSKAMAGMSNIYAWNKAKDQDGVSFSQVLSEQKLDIRDIPAAARNKDSIKSFVELHIGQNSTLDEDDKSIGIVETIAAPTRLKIVVEGVSGHSGTTPMDKRQDALVSAAMIILALQEIIAEEAYRGTIGTVGSLKVHPGAIDVIPGLVEMWVDLRGTDQESIIDCLQEIKDAVSTIADGQDTVVDIQMLSSEKPVKLDKDIIRKIEDACRKVKVSCESVSSGAEYDAMNMAYLAPAGVILIPCRSGLSHNLEEHVSVEDLMAGIEVLTETLYNLAK